MIILTAPVIYPQIYLEQNIRRRTMYEIYVSQLDLPLVEGMLGLHALFFAWEMGGAVSFNWSSSCCATF
jgi:hypothetical protein